MPSKRDARRRLTIATTLGIGVGLILGLSGPMVRPAAAVSCTYLGHVTSLTAGSGTPKSGTAATSFKFAVTFKDSLGLAPTSISVRIDDAAHAMTATSTTYTSGVTYRFATKLKVGSHSYSFRAESSRPGGGAGHCSGSEAINLSGGSVAVAAPTPKPSPKPSPRPSPKPSLKPSPKPSPNATSNPRPSPKPSPKGTQGPGAAASQAPGGSTKSPQPSASQGPKASPSPSASARASASPPLTAGGGVGRPTGGDGSGGNGPGGFDLFRSGPGSPPLALALAVAIALAGGLLLLAVSAGRRRRTDETALEPSMMTGGAAVATMATGPSFAATRSVSAPTLSPDTPLEEAAIPRWRRPSVRAARQMSDRSAPVVRVPLRFREAAAAGTERRIVGYRLVRVGSEPDELAGEEVGRLDRGDEVEVMHEEASYVLVRTPDDTVGWVHRTTLEGGAATGEPEDLDAPIGGLEPD